MAPKKKPVTDTAPKIANGWQFLADLIRHPVSWAITIFAAVFLAVFFSVGFNVDSTGFHFGKTQQIDRIPVGQTRGPNFARTNGVRVMYKAIPAESQIKQ